MFALCCIFPRLQNGVGRGRWQIVEILHGQICVANKK